ncbi:MAG TPA: FAD-dependent monooxygenase [Dongiaceae bacterium]|nr:FAD-dependent monooxygenase [Dongiaceae bacterium]
MKTGQSVPEVLVVGAGPTGLTLAITLRRFGIPLRIIDRAAQPATVSKALAVWSGSMEALHGMGVMDQLLAEGQRLRALTVGTDDRQLAVLAVGDGIDSPYPFPLLLAQSRTEAILTARLAALGVTIERGVELTGLVQDAEGVTATLTRTAPADAAGSDNGEQVRVAYLVGCDGARSAVRHALEIPFEGYTEPGSYVLGDVKIDGGALDHRSIYVWWGRGGTIALFPFEQAVWRIFAERKGSGGSGGVVVGGRAGDSGGDAPPTLDELQATVDRHGPPGLRLRDPSWLSAFRINERLAARYRSGRCFLAGDAAHIHSPAGGQGMNTGIQDAVNLGWKLAYVLRGVGDAGILFDSYEAERRPVARAVVDGSARRLHVAFATGRLMTLLRSAVVAVFGRSKKVQAKLQVELSETEIVYRAGPLVALGNPPRRPRRTDPGSRARDGELHGDAAGDAAGRVGVSGAETGGAETIGGEIRGSQRLWAYLADLRHTLLLFPADGRPFDLAGISDVSTERLQILRLDDRADPGGALRRRYHLDGAGWVLVRPDQVVAARGTGTDLTPARRYLDRILR